MKIRRLSHREFIYLNKDTPNIRDITRYLLTISDNQIKKAIKKGRLKKIKSTLIRVLNNVPKNTASLLSRKQKKHLIPKKHSFVPQPEFSTYTELKNSIVNTGNISGYWGEYILKKELKKENFLLEHNCKVENKYGDIDIIAYKKRKDGRVHRIEFHEVKTLTKGCSKDNIDLSIDSQMRHLLSPQQRKGGKAYVQEVLLEQEFLGNHHATKLLHRMKSSKVQYFLHKRVIDTK